MCSYFIVKVYLISLPNRFSTNATESVWKEGKSFRVNLNVKSNVNLKLIF